MTHSRSPALLAALLAGITLACGDDDPTPEVEIDRNLTLPAVFGGDLVVTAAIEGCKGTPPARLVTPQGVLASVAALEPLQIQGALDDRARFVLVARPSVDDAGVYGLPMTLAIHVEVDCSGKTIRSDALEMTYVPTDAVATPAIIPRRFWAADDFGVVMICDDTRLVLHANGVEPTGQALDVGFSCATAELRGVLGERRYLITERTGIAAIDPGPVLAWTRRLDYEDGFVDATSDPIVLSDETGEPQLTVLDYGTGEDKVGPLALTYAPVALTRDVTGDVLALETAREAEPAARVYYVQRFMADGTSLGLTEVVRYAWDAPSYYATFSFAGDRLFYVAAPTNDAERWIASASTLTGESIALSTPNDPWRSVLGDAYGRLLVASEDAFRWIDPELGVPMSEAFAPDSGAAFVRIRVDEDGSTTMLADPAATIARGFYVFGPLGDSVVRFNPGSAFFRWMAQGWEDRTLVSYFNELHLVPSRATFAAARDGQ